MEAGLALVLSTAFDALAAGLHRGEILDKVHALQAQGATPEQVAEAIRNMRTASETDAQAAINKAS